MNNYVWIGQYLFILFVKKITLITNPTWDTDEVIDEIALRARTGLVDAVWVWVDAVDPFNTTVSYVSGVCPARLVVRTWVSSSRASVMANIQYLNEIDLRKGDSLDDFPQN
jgi:hypothetical protein